jgi:hypothetical protein
VEAPDGVADPQSVRSPCARKRATALALAILAGVLNLAISLHFDALFGFDQLDLFFNADASARLRCMIEGRCGGRSSFSHPNLALFVNPPVAVAAVAMGAATGIEPERARRIAALGVSPLASAAKAPIVFYVLLALGLTLAQAAVLALLSAVSFSQLAFGSIPESFALSGLLLAAGYGLALRCMRTGDRRLWPWLVLGVLVVGITISNLVAVAILFAAVGLASGERSRVLLARMGALVAVVLAATIALVATLGSLYELKEVDLAGGSEYTQRWLKTHRALDRAAAMPSAFAHTFTAPAPGLGRNLPATLAGSKYPYRFLIEHREWRFCVDHWLGAVFFALFAIGAFGYRRAEAPARWLCGASLAILGFNAGLHAVWGVDLILYSQHWQMALVVLLAGLYREFASMPRVVTVVLLALVVASGLENLRAGGAMVEAMQIEHRGSGQTATLKDYRR